MGTDMYEKLAYPHVSKIFFNVGILPQACLARIYSNICIYANSKKNWVSDLKPKTHTHKPMKNGFQTQTHTQDKRFTFQISEEMISISVWI